MAVFGNEDFRAGPLDVCGDESIGRFESPGFIFRAQFKWNKEIFIDDCENMDEIYELFKSCRGDVAFDLFRDHSR